jgi:hypothetical protein
LVTEDEICAVERTGTRSGAYLDAEGNSYLKYPPHTRIRRKSISGIKRAEDHFLGPLVCPTIGRLVSHRTGPRRWDSSEDQVLR